MSTASALEAQLEYYCGLNNPTYAVLVTGEWGVGKTHQVNAILEKKEPYYISLFGITQTSEIYEAAFAKMFPARHYARKTSEKLKSVSFEVPGVSIPIGEILGGITNAVIKQNISSDRPIIFDDLERCSLKINEVMGVLNDFVEHHKCNVVIIAHDEKIVSEFNTIKEKIIGVSVEVAPQVESALDAFISDAAEVFASIKEYRDCIRVIFDESGFTSLRVLRHVVLDAARLLSCIDRAFIANNSGISEVVKLFCAINIHYKMGLLTSKDDFNDIVSKYYKNLYKMNEDAPSSFGVIFSKFRAVNFGLDVFTGNVLRDIIVNGIYDQEGINYCLSTSVIFRERDQVPSWKIIYSFDSLDNNIIMNALKSLLEELRGRNITRSGEILHSYAALMMLSTKGVIKKSIASLERDAVNYINGLARRGLLEPRGTSWDWDREFATSWMGNSYWVEEESYGDSFSSVKAHLIQMREAEFDKTKSHIVQMALEHMNNSGSEFYSLLSFTSDGNNEYINIPFLQQIKARSFVNAWLKAPKQHWHMIAAGLKDRYQNGGLERELAPEKEWRLQVQQEVLRHANNSIGLSKARLDRIHKQMHIAVDLD